MKTFDWIYKLSCWIIGGIFIYAGGIKLLEPKTFAVLIDAYGILPEILLMPVAIILSSLEVVAGIGLIFDLKGGLPVVAALLALFIVILGYGLWIGLDVDCGCFGPQDPEAEAFHGLKSSLYRDLAMFAGTVFIYAWRRYRAIKPKKISVMIKQFIKRRTQNAYV